MHARLHDRDRPAADQAAPQRVAAVRPRTVVVVYDARGAQTRPVHQAGPGRTCSGCEADDGRWWLEAFVERIRRESEAAKAMFGSYATPVVRRGRRRQP